LTKSGVSSVTDKNKKTKSSLDRALIATKYATASKGKFQKRLDREPKEKHTFHKRAPLLASSSKEKEKNLKTIDRIFRKDPILDVDKAMSVRKLQREKQRRLAKQTENTKKPKKHSKK